MRTLRQYVGEQMQDEDFAREYEAIQLGMDMVLKIEIVPKQNV